MFGAFLFEYIFRRFAQMKNLRSAQNDPRDPCPSGYAGAL